MPKIQIRVWDGPPHNPTSPIVSPHSLGRRVGQLFGVGHRLVLMGAQIRIPGRFGLLVGSQDAIPQESQQPVQPLRPVNISIMKFSIPRRYPRSVERSPFHMRYAGARSILITIRSPIASATWLAARLVASSSISCQGKRIFSISSGVLIG